MARSATAGASENAGATPEWEPIVGAIGPKVRELRQQLGLSLQQLATRAGVSAAAIHKVERNDMVPTITTLLKLADALERPIGHFVGDDTPTAVASVVPAGAGADVATDEAGVARTAITAAPERFRVGGTVAVVDPDGSGATEDRHAGEVLVHLLEGVLEFDVAGERHTVEAGGTIQFPADRHTRWRNTGAAPARALWLTTRGS